MSVLSQSHGSWVSEIVFVHETQFPLVLLSFDGVC